MKYAFVCDTPYQILSTLSFVLDKKNEVDCADLYIETLRCQNRDMAGIATRIIESHIFTNVYILKSLPLKYRAKEKWLRAYEWLFPKNSFNSAMEEKINLKDKEYDYIGITGPFAIQRAFLSFFPKTPIIFLEDGSGSYNARIGVNLLSWRGALIQSLLKRGPRYIYPQKCYLYYPDFYTGEYSNRLEKLNFPMDKMDVMREIFGDKDSHIYAEKKFILFGQPYFNKEKKQDTDQKVLRLLKQRCNNDLLIRPHPANNTVDYHGMVVDNNNTQWEIVCAENVFEDKILIGKYSTAQLVPKLIFDREPYLVFIYKLFGFSDERIENGIAQIKKLYRDKSKIVIVNDIDELEQVISSFISID